MSTAFLSITENGYYLDWNNNSLDSKPLLHVNGSPNNSWLFIDTLLDIFRRLPQKPITIYIPPIENAKEKILDVFCTWSLGKKSQGFIDSLDEKIWLDGRQLSLLTHNISELKMGICTVVNIDWGNSK